jgi:hypothetical protein
MRRPERRTFSLPTEQASDAAVEKRLREEVLGVYDAMHVDPGRAVPAEKVFATIRARHAHWLKKA